MEVINVASDRAAVKPVNPISDQAAVKPVSKANKTTDQATVNS